MCLDEYFGSSLHSWFKLKFDGSVHQNHLSAGFVVWNNIEVLLRADSVLAANVSMLETEIRGLREALSWVSNLIF